MFEHALTELVSAMRPAAPSDVLEAAGKLRYRDLITVNLMINQASGYGSNMDLYPRTDDHAWPHPRAEKTGARKWPPRGSHRWWRNTSASPGNDIWNMDDQDLIDLTIGDWTRAGFLKKEDVIDAFVVRIPKAYPMYELGYREPLEKVMDYVDGFENLQIVGRYGTYKYNNMDHSIKTGILAARNILGESHDFHAVNLEKEYHERRSSRSRFRAYVRG